MSDKALYDKVDTLLGDSTRPAVFQVSQLTPEQSDTVFAGSSLSSSNDKPIRTAILDTKSMLRVVNKIARRLQALHAESSRSQIGALLYLSRVFNNEEHFVKDKVFLLYFGEAGTSKSYGFEVIDAEFGHVKFTLTIQVA